jgi:hypothetical protein
MPYSQGEKLFSKVHSRQIFEAQRQSIRNEVERLTEGHLFGDPIDDVLENFVTRYEFDPLMLHTDRTERVEEGEIEHEVFDQMCQNDELWQARFRKTATHAPRQ